MSIALIVGNTPLENATLGAVPEPEITAMPQTDKEPSTCAYGPELMMKVMMDCMNPTASNPAMKQLAVMMSDITFA
jgi:hypothetical protein